MNGCKRASGQSRCWIQPQEQAEQLEGSLAVVGDDAQLGNVDLHQMLANQQQMLRLLSLLSEHLGAVALTIVRKVGD